MFLIALWSPVPGSLCFSSRCVHGLMVFRGRYFIRPRFLIAMSFGLLLAVLAGGALLPESVD